MTTLRNLMREAERFSVKKKQELFNDSVIETLEQLGQIKIYGSNGEHSSLLIEICINEQKSLQHFANTFERIVVESKAYNDAGEIDWHHVIVYV